MHVLRSDFALIGERDYVHGPSMFELFRRLVLETAGVAPDSAFSFRFFRVNQPMYGNGSLVVAPADDPRPQWGRAAAEMLCAAGERSWYVGLYERDTTPITRREPAREKDYVQDVRVSEALSGAATLTGIGSQAELFQAVVEANKQVHLKSLTGDPCSSALRFRFAYCLNYTCPRDLGTGTASVSVTSEGLRDAGEYRFSLTRLGLQIGGRESVFRLCFASKDLLAAVS